MLDWNDNVTLELVFLFSSLMNALEVYPQDAHITLKKHTLKSLQRLRFLQSILLKNLNSMCTNVEGLHASSAHVIPCARMQSSLDSDQHHA